MQPRPSFNRELLIPIAVGAVSILGIAWIFLTSDLGESLIPPTAVPTAIPFDVSSSETATLPHASMTPTLEETPPTTATKPVSYPGPPAETLPSTSIPATGTLITESPPTPSATPTSDQVLTVGKYDDKDRKIAYDRFWDFRMNSGTANAYRGTLHISNSIGSEASFQFTGQRLYLGYQRGRNFGIVTVIIDNQTYSFHEQAFDRIWRSPQLTPGTHSVRIIHESGESINLDYIEVLD